MIEAGDGGTVMHHAAPVTDTDEHAGHDMTGMQGETQGETQGEKPEAPVSPDAPAHETCPDLAHCAVAAVPTALAPVAAPVMPVGALRVAAVTAPLSVGRALEPPPPKA